VQQACQWVQDDPRRIVTFGIRPTYPAESFGYIERGEVMSSLDPALKGAVAHRVKMFREKPSAQVAAQYLAAGTFYWNSGIFVWNAQTILEALRTFEPAMHEQLRRIADALETAEFEPTLDSEFARIAGKSIDYAVLERYDPVVVIEAPFAWDDVGSWCSLARLRETDEGGNTIAGRHLGLNSRGCIVRGEGEHLIVTVGLEDCIVVHTADATLVARKQDEESIRQVVQLLQERGWTEYL
jgi:mannose-1-phosphate guanylyltransferase